MAEPIKNFDSYVTSLMRQWLIPGAAIGVVQNDQVTFSQGFGVRKVEATGTVDGQTVFPLGSTSKPITGSIFAILVSEGLLNWDDPVCLHLPDFQMPFEESTDIVTIRDLLSMQSGIAGTPSIWRYEVPVNPEEFISRLQYLTPKIKCREKFVYSDFAYMLASYLATVVCGCSFGELAKQKLFKPLGMNNSNASMTEVDVFGNMAFPHTMTKSGIRSLEFINKENALGAAAVNSNLEDMLRWVRMELAFGRLDNQRVATEETIKETWKNHVSTPAIPQSLLNRILGARLSRANPHGGYGLGWMIEDYSGHAIISHRGAVPGAWSNVLLLPDVNAGIVILANSDARGGNFARLLGYRIAEALLGLPLDYWAATGMDMALNFQKTIKPIIRTLKRKTQNKGSSSRPLEHYVGRFNDRFTGCAEIESKDSKLIISLWKLRGELKRIEGDNFICTWNDPYLENYPTPAKFVFDSDNKAIELEIAGSGKFSRYQDHD